MNAYIYIENGIYLQAKAFGKGGSGQRSTAKRR